MPSYDGESSLAAWRPLLAPVPSDACVDAKRRRPSARERDRAAFQPAGSHLADAAVDRRAGLPQPRDHPGRRREHRRSRGREPRSRSRRHDWGRPFTVVRQENQYLGAARNAGARHATGDLLAFVDDDDLIDPKYIRVLVRALDGHGRGRGHSGHPRRRGGGRRHDPRTSPRTRSGCSSATRRTSAPSSTCSAVRRRCTGGPRSTMPAASSSIATSATRTGICWRASTSPVAGSSRCPSRSTRTGCGRRACSERRRPGRTCSRCSSRTEQLLPSGAAAVGRARAGTAGHHRRPACARRRGRGRAGRARRRARAAPALRHRSPPRPDAPAVRRPGRRTVTARERELGGGHRHRTRRARRALVGARRRVRRCVDRRLPRHKASRKCETTTGDLRSPLVFDRRFDLVVCTGVVDHLPSDVVSGLVASLVRAGRRRGVRRRVAGRLAVGLLAAARWPAWWDSLFEQHGYEPHDVIRWDLWADSRVDLVAAERAGAVRRARSVRRHCRCRRPLPAASCTRRRITSPWSWPPVDSMPQVRSASSAIGRARCRRDGRGRERTAHRGRPRRRTGSRRRARATRCRRRAPRGARRSSFGPRTMPLQNRSDAVLAVERAASNAQRELAAASTVGAAVDQFCSRRTEAAARTVRDHRVAVQTWLSAGSSGRPARLFDEHWYVSRYPDVAESALSPLWHYRRHGSVMRRSPVPFFDPGWYVDRYPEVVAAGARSVRALPPTRMARGQRPASAVLHDVVSRSR